MAMPFCFTHDLDWQDDCPGCVAGKSVREMMQAHVAVYTSCTNWPLCEHGQDGPLAVPTDWEVQLPPCDCFGAA